MKLYLIIIAGFVALSLFNHDVTETPLTPYEKCMVLYGDTLQATQCDLLR